MLHPSLECPYLGMPLPYGSRKKHAGAVVAAVINKTPCRIQYPWIPRREYVFGEALSDIVVSSASPAQELSANSFRLKTL